MIKAILYDLGDIFFEAHYWRKWMYEEFVKSGHFTGHFSEFYYMYDDFLKPVYENKISYEKQYEKFLKHLKVVDYISFTEKAFRKKKFFEKNRKLFTGVRKTIQIISNLDIKNIIITDNESTGKEIFSTVIVKYKIGPYIHDIISSKDIGTTKPDPFFFSFALNKYDLNPEEVLFTGHDKDEIDGCVLNGIRVVEFNNYLEVKTSAEFKIKNITELVDIITALNLN